MTRPEQAYHTTASSKKLQASILLLAQQARLTNFTTRYCLRTSVQVYQNPLEKLLRIESICMSDTEFST